jgi:hypothetical protein
MTVVVYQAASLRKEVTTMMARYYFGLAAASALLLAMSAPSYAQRTVVGGKPRVTITPAPWIPTPQLPPSIFPASPSFNGAGSDFFPAAPTDLFNNTTLTGYYYPVANITADDANIPNNLDSDGDDTYYITQIEFGVFVPSTAQQPVQAEFYIGTDPTNLTQIATFEGTLNPGSHTITLTFPRCQPYELAATEVTGSDSNVYDRFWLGVRFPQYCPPSNGGGPGWLLAAGPGFQEDVFYWQGNTNCPPGNSPAGYYFFGGTPRASFYLRVLGAATLADAIVSNPDIDGSGCVDDADLLAVLFAFGSTGSGLDEDVNCDGTVDDADLLAVLFAFGEGC